MPAAELEALVLTALRHHLQASGTEPQPIADSDRDLIERHVERITLTPKHITLQLRPSSDTAPAEMVAERPRSQRDERRICAWRPSPSLGLGPCRPTVKGIVHVPGSQHADEARSARDAC